MYLIESGSSLFIPAAVIFYEYFVPEGERLDSALKRHKDALTMELKLWEGYLFNVCKACIDQNRLTNRAMTGF